MTEQNKALICELARKTVHAEALALKRLEASIDGCFAEAVELILASRG